MRSKPPDSSGRRYNQQVFLHATGLRPICRRGCSRLCVKAKAVNRTVIAQIVAVKKIQWNQVVARSAGAALLLNVFRRVAA